MIFDSYVKQSIFPSPDHQTQDQTERTSVDHTEPIDWLTDLDKIRCSLNRIHSFSKFQPQFNPITRSTIKFQNFV